MRAHWADGNRSVKLAELARGTDNNFNLLRMGAALAVLITHSFALAIGTGDAEPLRGSLGMTLGSISVDIFFITSGFLVTGSLLTRQNLIEFIWARVLRIFPALIAMLGLTVFGLGCFFTSLPLSSYLADTKTFAAIQEGLTRHILRFVENPSLVSTMGAAARKHMEALYSFDAARSRLEEMYASALG
jgi:peptidoglycan/LPS O-acetylase OafA/YrhL